MATAVSNRIVRGWKQGSFDVPLGTDLSVGSPLAVASQCTHYGGDGGWARLRGEPIGCGKALGVGLGGNHHRHRSRSFLILCQGCHRRGYDLRHREESYQGNCERVCLLRPLCSLNLWHEIGMHENPSPGKRGSEIKWQENTNARHCKGCEFIPSRLNPDWRILGCS